MDVKTEVLELNVTRDVADMLRDFAAARNGSIHNVADSALRRGLQRLFAESPNGFRLKLEADRFTFK